MPTNRKRKRRKFIAPIREDFSEYLLHGSESNKDFDFFHFKNDRDKQQQLWNENRNFFMASWLKDQACKRPFAWWFFEASEKRRMVSGIGVQAHERCNYKQAYIIGAPKYWTKIDENNPPMFESQAAFLQRLGSLNDGEAKFLRENPGLLQSESIFNILDPRIVLDVSKYS